jgi:hypothetical protein
MFLEAQNFKFYGNKSSGSRADTCERSAVTKLIGVVYFMLFPAGVKYTLVFLLFRYFYLFDIVLFGKYDMDSDV